jgi:hypothetical protein
MGSKNKYYGVQSAEHGFDDVGLAQPTGTISAIADSKTASRWRGKLMITVNDNTLLRVGQPIRIAGLDADHNGLTRILAIPKSASDGTGTIIVNVTFNALDADVTGTWAIDGGAGAWDAFMPIGADLTAANLAITFWDPKRQGSDENAVNYTKDQKYFFPAGIKTIQISTAGNVRLFRSATLRPWGKDAQ